MGIFGDILQKLRGAAPAPAPAPDKTAATGTTISESTRMALEAGKALQGVDVDKVLADLAAKKGGGGNYKVSIVDLLKLLDLDSSLAARTKLAEELGVKAGPHGSAEQNIALHKAVIKKLEENGGKVPPSLKA